MNTEMARKRSKRMGMTVEIVVGDVRDALATMPDKSVHCVVTSPPYFGLRSYGTPPQVWGGDAGCAHEWGEEIPGSNRGGSGPGKKQASAEGYGRAEPRGGFCVACGAWLGHLGLEPTLALFIGHMVEVFREVRRVLRDDGTLWCNIGDSYASDTFGQGGVSVKQASNAGTRHSLTEAERYRGIQTGFKKKDLMMVPARIAIALQDDGWTLRSDIIWHKRAPMPESVTDRPTSAHEHIFLLSKQPRYFYDGDAVREEPASYDRKGGSAAWTAESGHTNGIGSSSFHQMNPAGANLRNVWSLSPEPFPDAHFATFPTEIPRRAIKAGTSERGCCPDCGAGWKRVTERIDKGWDGSKYGERVLAVNTSSGGTAKSTLGSSNGKLTGEHQTTGWEPTCECGVEGTVPATVLDPFSGSGTTGMVAAQLGRNYVGVELNPVYAEMSRKRIVGDAPMFNVVTVREVRVGQAIG